MPGSGGDLLVGELENIGLLADVFDVLPKMRPIRCHFLLEFHPAPRPFDPEYPANRPFFHRFQSVCVKYRQSVEWMTGCEILRWEGTVYEKVMDVPFGSAACSRPVVGPSVWRWATPAPSSRRTLARPEQPTNQLFLI